MLTAAVRDLHRCYPNQYVTDVRTFCPELWENNPYLTHLDERDSEVATLDCEYPLIRVSNQLPYHCLHGFMHFLNEKLGLNIRPTDFKGDIHLTPQEKWWYSQVQELTGEDTPFWIVVAGGKFDATIKWWQTKRYQEVIDNFRGKIQFVQVGERGHHHPKLEGVIDLRGKTNLRQLVRLVYHSQGVLCGVTAAMHLAAAVESKPGNPPTRACVVIAGGREPPHWEAYPGHQFIHSVGQLACCANGGCWRARTVPLGDGDERDHPDRLCQHVTGNLPRCMDLIHPKEVIRRIEAYYEGGILSYLSNEQAAAGERGIQLTSGNSFETPAPAVRNQTEPLRKLLIQQGSGIYSEMLELTHHHHAQYAKKHGFDFWSIRGDVQKELHPAWNKIRLIQMGLAAGFEFIVWLDADTLILRPEVDFFEALANERPIGMCRHPLPFYDQPWHYNSGVMFIRNTEATRIFFHRVWVEGPLPHPWEEQARINALALNSPELIQQVPDIWNSTAGANEVKNAVVQAWHGQGAAALPALKSGLAQVITRKPKARGKERNGAKLTNATRTEPAALATSEHPRP